MTGARYMKRTLREGLEGLVFHVPTRAPRLDDEPVDKERRPRIENPLLKTKNPGHSNKTPPSVGNAQTNKKCNIPRT